MVQPLGSTCPWEHSTGTEQAGVLEGRGEVCRQLVDKSAMVEYSNSSSFYSVANCVIISNILFLINNLGQIWLTFHDLDKGFKVFQRNNESPVLVMV